MDIAEHQIMIAAARDEAFARGYSEALRVKKAAFDMVQQESYINGFRAGLEQGKLERDALWVSGLTVAD